MRGVGYGRKWSKHRCVQESRRNRPEVISLVVKPMFHEGEMQSSRTSGVSSIYLFLHGFLSICVRRDGNMEGKDLLRPITNAWQMAWKNKRKAASIVRMTKAACSVS